MKYSDHLFYYKPVKLPRPGGLGATIFIVKGATSQVQVDTMTTGWNIEGQKRQEMEADGIDPQETEHILVTHAHPDHCRGTEYWAGIGHPTVRAHPEGAEVLADQMGFVEALIGEVGEAMAPEFTPVSPKLMIRITNRLWGAGTPVEAEHLEDRQVFDLGGATVTVYFTPGHAMHHTSYLVTEPGGRTILLSGDLISFKDMGDGAGKTPLPSINNPLSSYEGELASLQLFVDAPPDVLFTSHYGAFEGKTEIRALFSQARDTLLRLREKTIQILEEAPGPIPFDELTHRVVDFKKYLSGIGTRKGSMWTILKSLRDEGLVSPDFQQVALLRR